MKSLNCDNKNMCDKSQDEAKVHRIKYDNVFNKEYGTKYYNSKISKKKWIVMFVA